METYPLNTKQPTPTPYKVHKACIFALNSDGQNRIYAQVQPGKHDDQRTSDAECEATAAFVGIACNSYDLLEKAPVNTIRNLCIWDQRSTWVKLARAIKTPTWAALAAAGVKK